MAEYHVAYYYKSGVATGYGCCDIADKSNFITKTVLSEMRENIMKKDNFENVVIINCFKLGKERAKT